MCGLIGAYCPGGAAVDDAALERMRDRMTHRGPDGAGLWRSADQSCALAHRRLSIIDLSEEANQPFCSDDGSVVLIFNGELYNHAEIRRQLEQLGHRRWRTDHSDTEVLLRAYLEWGIDCTHRFHGMFSFVIHDERQPGSPVVHLVRDRMGVKPLYLARTGSREWVFGSEIRGVLAHPDITPEMDLTAFWHYLTFIVAPAPLTMFRGIFKVPAGTRVRIDADGRAVAERWWDATPSLTDTLSTADLSFDEAADELTRLLRASISRRMVSDVPFGVLLSGGVDSSLNVALMSELMDRPVTTFTIGYEGHEGTNEFGHAQRIADRYATDHHERRITTKEALDFLPLLVELQDEPIADNVCIPLYFLAELVKQSGTTVVQVGEGADEHFLGYWWVDHYRRKYKDVYLPALQGRNLPWWRRLRSRAPGRLAAGTGEDVDIVARATRGEELFWGGAACFWGDIRDRLTPSRSPFAQQVDCPVEGLMPQQVSALDSGGIIQGFVDELGDLADPAILQKITHIESRLRLPEHLLMRVDKMTMAHSVEARVPFLDHDVTDFARRLPLEYKNADGVGKRVLKRAAEPFLDHDAVYRTKQGFGAPMDQWFADPVFGPRLLAAYEGSAIAKSGLLDNEVVTGMLEQQMRGAGGHGFHLWTVLNAVLWHESWVEGRTDIL